MSIEFTQCSCSFIIYIWCKFMKPFVEFIIIITIFRRDHHDYDYHNKYQHHILISTIIMLSISILYFIFILFSCLIYYDNDTWYYNIIMIIIVMMITVKAMKIWWLYKVVEREIRLLDIVTYFSFMCDV